MQCGDRQHGGLRAVAERLDSGAACMGEWSRGHTRASPCMAWLISHQFLAAFEPVTEITFGMSAIKIIRATKSLSTPRHMIHGTKAHQNVLPRCIVIYNAPPCGPKLELVPWVQMSNFQEKKANKKSEILLRLQGRHGEIPTNFL